MPLDDLVMSVRNQLPGQSPRAWSEQATELGQLIARTLIDHELGTWLERPVRPQDLIYCGIEPVVADALLQPAGVGTYLHAWRHLEEVRGAGLHLGSAELHDRFTADPAPVAHVEDLGALRELLFARRFATLEQAEAQLPTTPQLLEATMRHLYQTGVRTRTLQQMQLDGWTLLEVDDADETLLVHRKMGIVVLTSGEESTLDRTLAQLAELAGPALPEAIRRGATPLIALKQRWSDHGYHWEVDGTLLAPYAELASALGTPRADTLEWVSAVVDRVLAAVQGTKLPPWAACPVCGAERVEVGRLERVVGLVTLCRHPDGPFQLDDGTPIGVARRQETRRLRVGRLLTCRDCGSCRPFPEETLGALVVPDGMTETPLPHGMAGLLAYAAQRSLAPRSLPPTLQARLHEMPPQGLLQTRDVQLVYQGAVRLPDRLGTLAHVDPDKLDPWRDVVDRVRCSEPEVLVWELAAPESMHTRKVLALGLEVGETMAFLERVLGPVTGWRPLTERTAWEGTLAAAPHLEVLVVRDVLGAPGPFEGDSADLEVLEELLRASHAVVWVGSATAGWDAEGLEWAEEEGKLVAIVGTAEQQASLPDRPGLAKRDLDAPDATDAVAQGIIDRLDPDARQWTVQLRRAVQQLAELLPASDAEADYRTERHTELALRALMTDDPDHWLDLWGMLQLTMSEETGVVADSPLRPSLAARKLAEQGWLPRAMIEGLWKLLEYEERRPGFAPAMFHWLQPVLREYPEPIAMARLRVVGERTPTLGHDYIHLVGLQNRLELGERPALGKALCKLWWALAAPSYWPATTLPLAGPLATCGAGIKGHRVVLIGTPELEAGLRLARMVAGLYAPVGDHVPEPSWEVPAIVVEPRRPDLVRLEQRARAGNLTVVVISQSVVGWAGALPPELLVGIDLDPITTATPPPGEEVVARYLPDAAPDARAELSALMHTVTFRAGEALFLRGQRIGGGLWVRSGEIEVDGQRCGPGTSLGFLAMSGRGRACRSAVAATDVVVDVVSREALITLKLAGSRAVQVVEHATVGEAVALFQPHHLPAAGRGSSPAPVGEEWALRWLGVAGSPLERIEAAQVAERFPGVWTGRIPAGGVLYEPGEPSRGLYLVLEGELQALQANHAAVYGPGQVAGGLGLVSAAHPERCAATADTLVAVFPKDLAREEWRRSHSLLREAVVRTLALRLR